MEIRIEENRVIVGREAASAGAKKISEQINKNGSANIIVATGASQLEMLEHLVKENIDWSKVTCFHLDEYIGIEETHPASFRKYLKERFVTQVNLKDFYYINPDDEPGKECDRLNELIKGCLIDVAFIGIGENGHLAFNDPPADFEVEQPYIIVDLDEKCRKQQLGEGWFPDLESVPLKAISMSIRQILKSKTIICTVPDTKKAEAVKKTVEDKITPSVPATILKEHGNVVLVLDKNSASLLKDCE